MKRKFLLAVAISIVASVAAAFGVGCSNPSSADNAPKHNYGEWVIDREASCKEVGRRYHTCQDEDCNEMEWESIPKTAHKNDIINRSDAGHSFTCSACNTTTEIETHNFKNGICIACGADENEDYNFEFVLSGDESYYTLKSAADKNATEVIIPSIYKGKSVKNIGIEAFKNFTKLKHVSIPDSITGISSGAFYGCTALEEISLPDSVQLIVPLISGWPRNGVFENCTSLECITLPDHCEVYGIDFNGCNNLKEIKVSENNAYHKIIDGNLYSKDGTTLVRYIGKQTEFEMPQSVTTIGSYAFSNCTTLKNITLHENLLIIEAFAFYGCTSLETATFENATGWRAGEHNINVLEGKEVLLTTDELSNTAQAAKYLMDKYCNYSWTNSKIFENNN